MSYTTKQRNDVILLIGNGNANVTNVPLYEALQTFNWLSITKPAGNAEQAVLTFSGKDLYRRLLKNKFR